MVASEKESQRKSAIPRIFCCKGGVEPKILNFGDFDLPGPLKSRETTVQIHVTKKLLMVILMCICNQINFKMHLCGRNVFCTSYFCLAWFYLHGNI